MPDLFHTYAWIAYPAFADTGAETAVCEECMVTAFPELTYDQIYKMEFETGKQKCERCGHDLRVSDIPDDEDDV